MVSLELQNCCRETEREREGEREGERERDRREREILRERSCDVVLCHFAPFSHFARFPPNQN